jgi:hypothetical protein
MDSSFLKNTIKGKSFKNSSYSFQVEIEFNKSEPMAYLKLIFGNFFDII